MSKPKQEKLSKREYMRALAGVAKITYQAAPMTVFVQFGGAIITAVLPIVTAYFAGLTTTALAAAYAGDGTAGKRAIVYVVITALLGVVMTGWNSLSQYVTTMMRYRVEVAIADRMYDHFLALDFWRYDDKETVDTFDRATQFSNFFPFIFDRLAGIVAQCIALIAGLIALVFVSWWLGLIMVVAVIPGIFIQFKLSRAQTSHWNKNVETRRKLSSIEYHLLRVPKYIVELRLYGLVRYLLDMRITLRDKDEKTRIEFERSYIFKRLGADVLEAGAEVIALLFTVMEIIHRQQPIGQFLYVQQVVSRTIGSASSFVSQVNSIDRDIANLFDYQRFMKFPERGDGANHLLGLPEHITFDHVSFRYPTGKSDVLKDISLSIERGERIAIVGENGAGKSTLVKLFLGLYTSTKGSILVDDQPLQDLKINEWHQKIGVLQQDYLEYTFANARDNVYFGDTSRPFDEKRFNSALERSEAKSMIDKLPKKDETYLTTWMEDDDGNSGQDLSGGQWQRLALARNFYRDAPIVVLDEPTSAIDALAESRIFERLFAEKDRTIIAISHRLTTVKKADIIYMLQDGKIVEQGTYAELLAKNGAFVRMFKSQM